MIIRQKFVAIQAAKVHFGYKIIRFIDKTKETHVKSMHWKLMPKLFTFSTSEAAKIFSIFVFAHQRMRKIRRHSKKKSVWTLSQFPILHNYMLLWIIFSWKKCHSRFTKLFNSKTLFWQKNTHLNNNNKNMSLHQCVVWPVRSIKMNRKKINANVKHLQIKCFLLRFAYFNIKFYVCVYVYCITHYRRRDLANLSD